MVFVARVAPGIGRGERRRDGRQRPRSATPDDAGPLALTFAQRVAPVNKDEITFGREFGILGNFGSTWMAS
jgi:hypothetical protein